MTVDARVGTPVIEVVAPSEFNLAMFYEDHGYTVVEVEQGAPLRAPFVFANCVGLVKAVLSIRAPGVVTPYQLFKRLQR